MTNNKKLVSELEKRKFQVSNGHYFEADNLAQILNTIKVNNKEEINLSFIESNTGLPFRQIRNRISVGRALGLFEGISLKLSPFGTLVSEFDLFIDQKETLEYMHYYAASNYTNLIWYELFNTVFNDNRPLNYNELTLFFRKILEGQFTEKSLKDHLAKELRFLMDLYLEKKLKKLELVYRDISQRIYRVRYSKFTPLILTAILYDFCEKRKANLYQIEELATTPGSPAVVFGVDSAAFRQEIEKLHDFGWLRYETTHGLDQIRLKPGYTSLEFLKAYYENREPEVTQSGKTVSGELF
ncbi:MAG: DUF4007 family protein [Spirochaetia bacterium]|jgi:hypothetical protein|nr:DUF4007 family protein [Spirochaetia bacterium]